MTFAPLAEMRERVTRTEMGYLFVGKKKNKITLKCKADQTAEFVWYRLIMPNISVRHFGSNISVRHLYQGLRKLSEDESKRLQ